MSDEKGTILLVEDDQNLGFVVQDALRRKGYTVHLCRDGKEGLRYFNSNPYDLCVLDVMLPQKDGFSLAEDIRITNEQVPIVFLTAKSQTEDRIAGFKAGGDDYLTKPFSHEELVLRIEAILRSLDGEPRARVGLSSVRGDATGFLARMAAQSFETIRIKDASEWALPAPNKYKLPMLRPANPAAREAHELARGEQLDVFREVSRRHANMAVG